MSLTSCRITFDDTDAGHDKPLIFVIGLRDTHFTFNRGKTLDFERLRS